MNFFVIDTNSLISSALIKNNVNAKAFDQVLNLGKIAISSSTIEELEEVLYRKKFDKYLLDNERAVLIDKIKKNSKLFLPTERITVCRDPKDNKFLELAVAANAACLLTGDKDLLILHPFRNIPILNSSDFLLKFKT
ncbi:putative toxin-antitoxin system toxin component, PIN family [Pedobacter sp. SD-b]|uniref:Toxin-antitoxin system toxin component, PIN family n=1 Tax=Pedobacter segetis TaxID=2793069 RepID=A0ABS1BH18_9SPHI|nr:putative toxin-antitoxin system toxin component, PIN family [Pedobacter segetis]MBK0382174.1 putative toxin-antitoxin system toxin component, PIN family [Pedobacter segetis]